MVEAVTVESRVRVIKGAFEGESGVVVSRELGDTPIVRVKFESGSHLWYHLGDVELEPSSPTREERRAVIHGEKREARRVLHTQLRMIGELREHPRVKAADVMGGLLCEWIEGYGAALGLSEGEACIARRAIGVGQQADRASLFMTDGDALALTLDADRVVDGVEA
jgi:hypothetical protein